MEIKKYLEHKNIASEKINEILDWFNRHDNPSRYYLGSSKDGSPVMGILNTTRIAKDLISFQPLSLPTGQIFYLNFISANNNEEKKLMDEKYKLIYERMNNFSTEDYYLIPFNAVCFHKLPNNILKNRSLSLDIFHIAREEFYKVFSSINSSDKEYIDIEGNIKCGYYSEWLDIVISCLYLSKMNKEITEKDYFSNKNIGNLAAIYADYPGKYKRSLVQFARKNGIAECYTVQNNKIRIKFFDYQ